MPRTVLTEESLKKYLNHESQSLNLDSHYWLKNSFVSKLGRMAPNLVELSLRRLDAVTNPVFADIFKHLTHLQRVDLSDCTMLNKTALILLIKNNPKLQELQLSGCINAVNDLVLSMI